MRHFWLLNKNIDRLQAEDDIRQAMTLISVGTKESMEKFLEDKRKLMGTVVVYDEEAVAKEQIVNAERDVDGLMALKGLGGLV